MVDVLSLLDLAAKASLPQSPAFVPPRETATRFCLTVALKSAMCGWPGNWSVTPGSPSSRTAATKISLSSYIAFCCLPVTST